MTAEGWQGLSEEQRERHRENCKAAWAKRRYRHSPAGQPRRPREAAPLDTLRPPARPPLVAARALPTASEMRAAGWSTWAMALVLGTTTREAGVLRWGSR